MAGEMRASVAATQSDWAIAAILFAVACMIRWLATEGEVYGDESWYLYLAQTWGSEPAAAVDHAWFHLLNRPLYYLVFHPAALGGFALFRGFACGVGALVVAAVYVLARDLGAARLGAAFAACVLSIQRSVVAYGAHGFPDVLASLFGVLAIWAAATRRAGWMSLFALSCVLCKESFVALPLIAAFVHARSQGRCSVWTWLTVGPSTTYVAVVTTLGWATPGVAMQGWDHTGFAWKHARAMGVGPELWPLLGWLAWRKQWDLLAIWLGLPAFYLAWSFGLGRGLSPWYVIGPATLSVLALALSWQPVIALLAARLRPAVGACLGAALLMLCMLPMAWRGCLRTAQRVLALHHGLPHVEAAPEVVAQLRRVGAERVLLVNCFWSFGYSHLRGKAQPASRVYWSDDAAASNAPRAFRAVDAAVVCRTQGTPALRSSLSTQGFETLLWNDAYWVVRAGTGQTEPSPAR